MDRELANQIEKIIGFIQREIPEARIVESNERYDGEDANLFVYPPLHWTEEQCLELQYKIASQATDPLIDHGYLILSYVYMPEQQVEEARSQMKSAVKSAISAKKILSAARELGLLDSTVPLPELSIA